MSTFRFSNRLLGVFLVFAGVGLLSALYAGLIRLGAIAPSALTLDGGLHGPLIINAFLGTLISLERTAALEKKWALTGPLFFAAAVAAMLFMDIYLGAWLFTIGAFAMFFTLLYVFYLQPKVYHLIMALGGLSLFIGNLFFLNGSPVFELVAWWMGFPILTIFGERLELNRIMRPPKNAQYLFASFNLLWIAGALLMHFSRTHGMHLLMLSLISSSLWLLKYDIARKTVKSVQWTKYSAYCLLSGYFWLFAAGVSGLIYGLPSAGPVYDALLHMVFVGFVFSMIFAHASVIIPSLSGKIIPWSPYFYIPLGLLHLTLGTRIFGDFMNFHTIRVWGAWGNVVAILLFLGGVLVRLITHKRRL